MLMSRYYSDNLIYLLTKKILFLSFDNIPHINAAILMSAHCLFLNFFIILLQMSKLPIYHKKTASRNLRSNIPTQLTNSNS